MEPPVATQNTSQTTLSVERRAAKQLTRPTEVSAYAAMETQRGTKTEQARRNLLFEEGGVHHPTREEMARPSKEWRMPPLVSIQYIG